MRAGIDIRPTAHGGKHDTDYQPLIAELLSLETLEWHYRTWLTALRDSGRLTGDEAHTLRLLARQRGVGNK